MNCEVRYNRKEYLRCKGIPRMKTLWLRPLPTGGSLKATRGSSRAAAADSIVTFGPFVGTSAAWAGNSARWRRVKDAEPYRVHRFSAV